MTTTLFLQMAGIGLMVGIAKTSIGGFGLISAALLTELIPARESVAVMLILLIIGDLFAVGAYWKQADWKFLKSLIKPVSVGLVFGGCFLWWSTNDSLKKAIGWIVIFLVMLYPLPIHLQKRNQDLIKNYPNSLRVILGSFAGFMSMVANAGGTPMSIYLLLRKESIQNFVANSAWFFFIVNVFKIPFTLGLGLISEHSFELVMPAIPTIALGAFIGKKIISKLNQTVFQNLTLISAALIGFKLVI